MKKIITLVALLASCGPQKSSSPQMTFQPRAAAPVPPAIEWVKQDPQGRLIYGSTPEGDRLPDFSAVGYRNGDRPWPRVKNLITLSPRGNGQDDSRAIQNALDALGTMPIGDNGMRGALLLKAGTFHIHRPLLIKKGNLVLRGEGRGPSGTLVMSHLKPSKDTDRPVMLMVGNRSRPVLMGRKVAITDSYVPVGRTRMRVADTSMFRVGAEVMISMATNAAWVHENGMDRIPPRRDGGKVVQWTPSASFINYERRIVAVDAKQKIITLDIAIPQPLAKRYGGATVQNFAHPGRISDVGIESLRIDNTFDASKIDKKTGQLIDEDHTWTFLRFNAVVHAWAWNIAGFHLADNLVDVTAYAKNVTVSSCKNYAPVSLVTGQRRYPFNISGQLSLVIDCASDMGRHDFVTGARVAGPNAFVRGTVTRAQATVGPHQRWATGTLFDNIISDGTIQVGNNGSAGSGHGWVGAQTVYYNCRAKELACSQPPLGFNWALGNVSGRYNGTCQLQSKGKPMLPPSLYDAQRAERSRIMAIPKP